VALPKSHLREQLEALPAGMPAVLVIGTAFTLVGSITGDVELTGVADGDPSGVAVQIMIAACSCADPDRDVDPDCKRHYPDPPAELVVPLALAIAASRNWERGGHAAQYIAAAPAGAGIDAGDVTAALAVLDVLVRPGGRNGIVHQGPNGWRRNDLTPTAEILAAHDAEFGGTQ